MDSKILISAIFAVSCVIGFCVILSFIIYKNKNSEDKTNDNKPTSTDPTSETKNNDPAQPKNSTPGTNKNTGGNNERIYPAELKNLEQTITNENIVDDNETDSNQADPNDKKSQESFDKSNNTPQPQFPNEKPEESKDNPNLDSNRSDLTVTNCEKCKKIKPQTGEKICKNCIETRQEEKTKDENTGSKPVQGDQINQNIVSPGSETVNNPNSEPQQNTNLTDSGTGNSTRQDKNPSEPEKGSIDITAKPPQGERIISVNEDQNSGAKPRDHQSENAGENSIQADEEKTKDQPNVNNTTGQGSAIEGSNAPQKETLPASNPTEQQSQSISSGNRTNEDMTQTEVKNEFDLIIVADHPNFVLNSRICDKTNAKLPGEFIKYNLDENQEAKKLFILKDLYVDLKNLATKSNNNFSDKSNKNVDLGFLNEIKNIISPNIVPKKLDEDQINELKTAFFNFIEYMKDNFFIRTGNLLKNNTKIEENEINTKNIVIAIGNTSVFLLFNYENDLYCNINQLVYKYFDKENLDNQNKIDAQNYSKILNIFAKEISLIYDPIIKNYSDIFFPPVVDAENKSNVEIENQKSNSIKYFLSVFYDENFDEQSKFNCKAKSEKSGAQF